MLLSGLKLYGERRSAEQVVYARLTNVANGSVSFRGEFSSCLYCGYEGYCGDDGRPMRCRALLLGKISHRAGAWRSSVRISSRLGVANGCNVVATCAAASAFSRVVGTRWAAS